MSNLFELAQHLFIFVATAALAAIPFITLGHKVESPPKPPPTAISPSVLGENKAVTANQSSNKAPSGSSINPRKVSPTSNLIILLPSPLTPASRVLVPTPVTQSLPSVPVTSPQTTTVSQSPPQVPTATSTAQPVVDNKPFEASWNLARDGDQISATITANKQINQCVFTLWNGHLDIKGNGHIGDNTCSFGPASNGDPNSKLWGRIEAITGEAKEFGDKQPCSGNVCD